MRPYLLVFVLLNLLNVSSVAGRDASLCDTIKVSHPKDSCRTHITVVESTEYSWDKKAYSKVSPDKVYQLENIHQFSVIPFLKSLIKGNSKSLNQKVENIKYHYQHTRLKVTYLNEDDSICNSYFAVERLELAPDQEGLLNHLKTMVGSEPLKVDILSEAPVSCFTYWSDDELIIVWYNIFDDENLIKKSVNDYLRKERKE